MMIAYLRLVSSALLGWEFEPVEWADVRVSLVKFVIEVTCADARG